ncbi:uncharacterized protein KD926_005089 [Aspergillus affinis]|uniref:uncharacterized protein n=1 Tax=Aspergillus affinis TaxID=1070780 RepID=UPI0022FF242B|nr:uncharacterized protein KD926_005089 [Aspergillus affinis]KAI9042759.1 hypothetical protein KD926_005089 [Aspergillus affinis]
MTDHDRRKRRRLAKSCEQCRQRKVRCDRTAPCGPCTRARGSLSCSYGKNATTTPNALAAAAAAAASLSPVDVIQRTSRRHHEGPGNHPTPSSNVDAKPGSSRESPQGAGSPDRNRNTDGSSISDIRVRLQRVEDLLSRRGDTSASDRDESLDQTLRELSYRVRGIEERLSEGLSLERAQRGENDGLCIDAVPSRLHASSSKMKLLGPSHYSNTLDKLQITQVLHSEEPDSAFQTLKTDLMTRIKECRGVRHAVKTRQSVQPNEPVPDLQESIPTRSICDELVDGYLRTFEPIHRILHLPSFWREYHHFWAQRSSSTPTTSTAFLMKLVLVLAIGTVFHPQRGKSGPDHDVHLTQTWIHAAQCWLIGPSEKATLGLDGIQVLCLLLIARQINAMGSSPWLSAGSLMQKAMAMGLHLDSKHFPALSVFQSEMRARLWATILEFAVQASMDSSIQPLLIPEFDTQPPSNLNDADFDPDIPSSSSPTGRPTTEVTDTSIQRLLHETFPLRAKIIQALTNRTSFSYTQTIHLGSQLQAACRNIAAFFTSTLNTSNVPSNTNRHLHPTPFHKAYLDMALRRWFLILHTPFMLQSPANPEFYFSRKVCLDTAMTIARYAQPLSLPSSPEDDLSRLLISGRGSLKGPLSLDIISILGLEVTWQIEESSDGTGDMTTTSMDEFATSSRAPLLNVMRHILAQLLRVIGLGTPSLKRYNLLAAILGQIRAMETGKCVKRVVYETVRESLGESVSLLQEASARGLPLNGEGQSQSDQGPGMGSLDFDLHHPDLGSSAGLVLDLDIPSILGLSDWLSPQAIPAGSNMDPFTKLPPELLAKVLVYTADFSAVESIIAASPRVNAVFRAQPTIIRDLILVDPITSLPEIQNMYHNIGLILTRSAQFPSLSDYQQRCENKPPIEYTEEPSCFILHLAARTQRLACTCLALIQHNFVSALDGINAGDLSASDRVKIAREPFSWNNISLRGAEKIWTTAALLSDLGLSPIYGHYPFQHEERFLAQDPEGEESSRAAWTFSDETPPPFFQSFDLPPRWDMTNSSLVWTPPSPPPDTAATKAWSLRAESRPRLPRQSSIFWYASASASNNRPSNRRFVNFKRWRRLGVAIWDEWRMHRIGLFDGPPQSPGEVIPTPEGRCLTVLPRDPEERARIPRFDYASRWLALIGEKLPFERTRDRIGDYWVAIVP